jgi:hypothetical protein
VTALARAAAQAVQVARALVEGRPAPCGGWWPAGRGRAFVRARERAVQWGYALGTWFFRGRYQLLARILGLQPAGGAGSPTGALFIEIDGLGHGHLIQAIDRGYMPFLGRLLRAGDYTLYRWRCGLASDTPPVQSGLFYGTSEGVVGFYWWDRQEQKRVVGANPNHMRRVQARVAARAGRPGLLAGGSSYSNIMSGDAEYAVLTIAGANPHWYKPGDALLRALAVLLLNPGKVVRFAFDATWELLQEMEDRAIALTLNRPRILEGAFPIVRILLNVLAREIVTAGTRLDMLRGVPVIYSCFIGYDVVAHHSGPLSRNALRVLRGIDGAIRKLHETRPWCARPYHMIILSDHGMTPCLPAADVFDSEFHDWVRQWWKTGAQATPQFRAKRRRSVQRLGLRRPRRRSGGLWLARLAGSVARASSGWLRTWGRIGAWSLELGTAGAVKLGERFLAQEEDDDAPRVAVISCGPLSQIWVRDVDHRLDLSEVDALCPGFVEALVRHPAVQLVIARERDELILMGRDGRARLRVIERDPVVVRVEPVAGSNPLHAFEEPEVVARQIGAYASMEDCGDLICFAAVFQPPTARDAVPGAAGERHIYSFEHQLGTHASLGGDQGYPFIILPAHVRLEVDRILRAADLHHVLRQLVPARREAPGEAALERAQVGKDGRATHGDEQPATIAPV